MEPHGKKLLSYLLSGLLGVVLPLVLPGCALIEALLGVGHQKTVDLLVEMPDTGGARLLPEKAEEFHIKPGVASKFYERTIAGSHYREGKLDWNLLMHLIKNDPSLVPKHLKLLPGVVVEFTPTSYKPIKGKQSVDAQKYRWAGLVTSKGKVVGTGLFIVDEKQQKISATIDHNDKVYKIVPLKNGNLRIYELDVNRYPEEIDQPESNNPPTNPEPGGPSLRTFSRQALMASDGQPCVIDVLVVYTQNAEETWLNLGNEDIRSEFDDAIGATNEAFKNSDVHAEVQIVSSNQIPGEIFESGSLATDLARLQTNQQIKEWRDAAGADLVTLWVAGGDWCGASPFFTSRLPNGDDAFSVISLGCPMKSLAHEIGHNLGARHTRADSKVADLNQNANFGHVSWRDRFRTIMAFNTECAANDVYCVRMPYYSNPDIPYPGTSTMTGVRVGEVKAADNHARLNETVCQAAGYSESRN